MAGESWDVLGDDLSIEENQQKAAQHLQVELDNIDKMMHDLVSKNKKAMDFLFTKFVIDAPLEREAIDIHRSQGKVDLLRWIFTRAEISQTRAENNKQ